MEGLVVTPTTDRVLMSSARLPVSMRSRGGSSSQMDTPASARAFMRSLMVPPVVRLGVRLGGEAVASGGGDPDAVACCVGNGLTGHAVLLVDPCIVGRGAVGVDRDNAAVVAD